MPVLPFPLPEGLQVQAQLGPGWADWLTRLPAVAAGVVEEWGLTHDGPPTHGYTALVLPVRTGSGRPAVLKVGYPHEEAEHEALALQRWGGRGAVTLLRADPHRQALLLERLHGEDLNDLRDVEACEVVAGLYALLHVPAPPQLRTLSSYAACWADELRALPRAAPLPRRLVDQAAALDDELAGDPATDGTLLHTDLHFENVLAGDRAEWLAIDPKPVSGDPHYEVAPLLWNRWEEVLASGNVRDAVRRRFHAVVDSAGLHEDRARAWVVARMMHNAMWPIRDAEADGRALDAEEGDWVTRCITIAKAVQD